MSLCALNLLIGPEVLALHRVEGRELRLRPFVVPEEHVVVQVLKLRDRGPLEGDQRRELARIVVLVGDFLLLLPSREHKFWIAQIGNRHIVASGSDDQLKSRFALLRVARGDQLADLGILERTVLLQQQRHHAHVLRMVGQRTPVVGRLLLHRLAGRDHLDRLALAELVGIIRCVAGAHGKGVGRVHRMHVLLAEIDVLQRVRLPSVALRFADRVLRKGVGR